MSKAKYVTQKKTGAEIEPCYRAIGARIEQIRDVLGITQQDLADRLKWSRGSIANIEVGRQRILLHDVETLATALGTTARALIKVVYP